MDLNDFFPFKNEFNKAYHGITTNATHTSEKPVFNELRVRRYQMPMAEISEFIVDKIDRWIGWAVISEKKAVGGISNIRAEVCSVLLFGLKINVTFGLFEEKDRSGFIITTVNAKAETQIDSRGDLGESRRVIRMILGAMDFNFKGDQINEEDYLYRSLDIKGASAAMQQMFNDVQLRHHAKPGIATKATSIEFKKKTPVQTIQIRPSVGKREETVFPATASDNTVQDLSPENSSGIEKNAEDDNAAKSKDHDCDHKKNPINIV